MTDAIVEDNRPNEYFETESPYSKTPGGQGFHGQFIIVYKASRKREGNRYISTPLQTFAVKEIRSNSPNKLNAVKEEIKKLRGLAHPNILVLEEAYYYRSDPCTVFLATLPWAPVSLEIFLTGLRKRKSTPGWYRPGHLEPWPSIIKQCLEGLNYLHNQPKPIKHKDLKPHNILLLEEIVPITRLPQVRPIIADFGISKHWVSGGWTENLGTYVFKAPEQLSGDPDSSVLESDIWSLGCCFAFILALLHADVPCLIDLWRLVMGPTNENKENENEGHEQQPTGFVHNIAQVKEILHSTGSHSKQSRMVIFVNEFRELVNKMLEENQGLRQTANAAHTQWLEVEARLQILALSLPRINIAFHWGQSMTVRTLEEMDLRPVKDLVELCNENFTDQLPLRGSWLRRQFSSPTSVHPIFFQRPALEAPVREYRLQEQQFAIIDVSRTSIYDRDYQLLVPTRLAGTWCSSAEFYQCLVQRYKSMEPRSKSMDSSWEFALVIADETSDDDFLVKLLLLYYFIRVIFTGIATYLAKSMIVDWEFIVVVMTAILPSVFGLAKTIPIDKKIAGRLSHLWKLIYVVVNIGLMAIIPLLVSRQAITSSVENKRADRLFYLWGLIFLGVNIGLVHYPITVEFLRVDDLDLSTAESAIRNIARD
jgi:serine/threonine protein kinase